MIYGLIRTDPDSGYYYKLLEKIESVTGMDNILYYPGRFIIKFKVSNKKSLQKVEKYIKDTVDKIEWEVHNDKDKPYTAQYTNGETVKQYRLSLYPADFLWKL